MSLDWYPSQKVQCIDAPLLFGIISLGVETGKIYTVLDAFPCHGGSKTCVEIALCEVPGVPPVTYCSAWFRPIDPSKNMLAEIRKL